MSTSTVGGSARNARQARIIRVILEMKHITMSAITVGRMSARKNFSPGANLDDAVQHSAKAMKIPEKYDMRKGHKANDDAEILHNNCSWRDGKWKSHAAQ